jgi:hypothetical protein
LHVQYKRLFEFCQSRVAQGLAPDKWEFFVLTEKGVPVKIRAVLRSPYGLTVGSGRLASPARLALATFLFTGE